jgi:hypothetical protein
MSTESHIARKFVRDREGHDATAREWTRKYAVLSIEGPSSNTASASRMPDVVEEPEETCKTTFDSQPQSQPTDSDDDASCLTTVFKLHRTNSDSGPWKNHE